MGVEADIPAKRIRFWKNGVFTAELPLKTHLPLYPCALIGGANTGVTLRVPAQPLVVPAEPVIPLLVPDDFWELFNRSEPAAEEEENQADSESAAGWDY